MQSATALYSRSRNVQNLFDRPAMTAPLFQIKSVFLSLIHRGPRALATAASTESPSRSSHHSRPGLSGSNRVKARKIKKFKRHVQSCFAFPFALVLLGWAQANSLKAGVLFQPDASVAATVNRCAGATANQFTSARVQSETTKKTA